jgi:hypothetical protein
MSAMSMISQMSLASKEKQMMDQSIYYSKHPEAIAALTKKFTQPLSAGLTSGVGNIVNASMAEQGLSQAPGIQSQTLAQALAPYMQNEQQMGLSEALAAIGLPTQALSSVQSVMNPLQLSASMRGALPGGGSGGGANDFALQQAMYSPNEPPDDTGLAIPDAVTGIPAGGGTSIYG